MKRSGVGVVVLFRDESVAKVAVFPVQNLQSPMSEKLGLWYRRGVAEFVPYPKSFETENHSKRDERLGRHGFAKDKKSVTAGGAAVNILVAIFGKRWPPKVALD